MSLGKPEYGLRSVYRDTHGFLALQAWLLWNRMVWDMGSIRVNEIHIAFLYDPFLPGIVCVTVWHLWPYSFNLAVWHCCHWYTTRLWQNPIVCPKTDWSRCIWPDARKRYPPQRKESLRVGLCNAFSSFNCILLGSKGWFQNLSPWGFETPFVSNHHTTPT